MENFNKQRFCKYANWDLTINKGFYRNLALVIFFTLLCPLKVYHDLYRKASTVYYKSHFSTLNRKNFN